jgi:predicted Zn-dependent protease
MLISDAQLSQMSLSAWDDMRRQTPISRDPAANKRLQRVGEKIAIAANRQDDPWEFVVFNTPEKNAFVLPGGKVGFYKGLMDIAESDDHVATVLGHEIGHVTGRHAAERYSQSALASVGMAVGQVIIDQTDVGYKRELAAVLGLGIQFGYLLPFSRRHELEADRLGVDYMHRSGYDVRQAVDFWQRMAGDDRQRPPELLSTHPDPVTRINDLRAYINARGYALI